MKYIAAIIFLLVSPFAISCEPEKAGGNDRLFEVQSLDYETGMTYEFKYIPQHEKQSLLGVSLKRPGESWFSISFEGKAGFEIDGESTEVFNGWQLIAVVNDIPNSLCAAEITIDDLGGYIRKAINKKPSSK